MANAATALDHLGQILSLLSDLDDGDRCQAFDAALAFYNAARPQAPVEPSGLGTTRLVHLNPVLDGHPPLRDIAAIGRAIEAVVSAGGRMQAELATGGQDATETAARAWTDAHNAHAGVIDGLLASPLLGTPR